MINFILIGLCLAAGMLFRRSGILPADAHKGINAWVIYLALPAVSFKYLPHITWDRSLLFPMAGPIIIWLGAWLLIRWYASVKNINKKTEGGLKLAAGLSNTSFLGFPLVIAYYGESKMPTAIIYDQVNFMLLATAGVIVAVHSSKKERLSVTVILKRVVKFPPFIGCMAALILPAFIDLTPVEPLFTSLAATVGPMALFSIGLQLKFHGWAQYKDHISVALLYKLIIGPALVLAIAFLSGIKGSIAQISVFEAAMPTLVTAGIIADQYDLDPTLVSLIIGIGIILSFTTTFLWWGVLRVFS